MVISAMPFIAVQLQVLTETSPICLVVLVFLIVYISLLLAYCLYKVPIDFNNASSLNILHIYLEIFCIFILKASFQEKEKT